MHREDNSKFLLYIEPHIGDKSKEPVNDELTIKLELAMKQAVSGTANYSTKEVVGGEIFRPGGRWRGHHSSPDKEMSSSCDYLLPNGLITNACAIHYLRWYRTAVPACDLEKLRTL